MRHILHADFDAFYTSVEQRDNPSLRGRPVVVGGSSEGRGVVAAASYEARRYGIRSAMPMRTAMQRCPHAVRVRPRFDRYGEVSREVMAIFRETATLVEPLSLDEAYLDVTESVTPARAPALIAQMLKARVKAELGLTISVGVATSKSVAKVASDMDKPDGLTVVSPGSEREFLAPLAADKLWGIGPKTSARLAVEGVHTIEDLASKGDEWLWQILGRNGPHMRRLALGKDDSPVVPSRLRKSVSAESTLAHDSDDAGFLQELVDQLSHRVGETLEHRSLEGRTVKLKLRLSDFTTFTRQKTVSEPVGTAEELARAASALLRAELRPGRMFRLVGVGVSGFDNESDEVGQLRLAGFD